MIPCSVVHIICHHGVHYAILCTAIGLKGLVLELLHTPLSVFMLYTR